MAHQVKNLPTMQETQETKVRSLSQEDAVAKEMTTYSGIFVWKIPWTEELSTPQSMGSQRIERTE